MKKLLLILGISLITLAGCGNSNTSTTVEQKEGDSIIFRAGWDPEANDDSPQMQYMREYTGENVHMEMLPLESSTDKLMLDLSSDVQMNMVNIPDEEFGTIVSKNLALDLRPYLEEYAPQVLENTSEEALQIVTDEETGAIYGIPSYGFKDNVNNVTMYRKDILEKENLKLPTTSEEVVTTVCELADRGYKTPWAINWGSAKWDYDMRHAFGVGYSWNVDGNEVKFLGEDERYLDYLEYANRIYECGGYGNDYETISQDDRNQRFIKGDSVFLTAPWWEADLQSEGMEADGLVWKDTVGVTAEIAGPEGIVAAEQEGGGAWNVWFIPSYMEEYAGQTLSWVNKLYDEEYMKTTTLGEEGVSFNYDADGNPYRLPNTLIPIGGPEYYQIGSADKVNKPISDRSDEVIYKSAENGEPVTAGEYARYLNSEYKEIGVKDPLAPALTLVEWGKQQECANNKINEFTDLYVTGAKTEEDFKLLGEDLNNTCNFEAVNEEINAWYTEYYA